jgi:hypothetical protein
MRFPASRRTGERIDELLKGRADGDVRTELVRLGVRKLVEEVLEAEVEDRLGRAYYGRGGEETCGYRNGYRRGRLKSAEAAIEYSVPQVADLGEPYRSLVRRNWRDARNSLSGWRWRCTRGGSRPATSRPPSRMRRAARCCPERP